MHQLIKDEIKKVVGGEYEARSKWIEYSNNVLNLRINKEDKMSFLKMILMKKFEEEENGKSAELHQTEAEFPNNRIDIL